MPQLTTPEALIKHYAKDAASIAEEHPATRLASFIDQLHAAARHLRGAGIVGATDVEVAACLLAMVGGSDTARRQVLLREAAGYLRHLTDMAAEYRLA